MKTLLVSFFVFLSPNVFCRSFESFKSSAAGDFLSANSQLSGLASSYFQDHMNFAGGDSAIPPEMRPAPMDSYGVPYVLKGYIRKEKDGSYFFDTQDGRSFRLFVDDENTFYCMRKAAEKRLYVKIEAWAHRADDLRAMRVKQVLRPDYGPDMPLDPPDDMQRMSPLFMEGRDVLGLSEVRFGHAPGGSAFIWKKALVRPSLVDKIYVIRRPFKSWGISHMAMLFTFKDGGLSDLEGNKRRGLVLSVEPMILKGLEMDFFHAMDNTFPIVWNFFTWEEYVSCAAEGIKRSVYEGNVMTPYAVNLTDEQRQKLVSETLRQASLNRRGEFYHLITHNCTISLVVMMNRVLPDNRKVPLYLHPGIYHFSAYNPNVFFRDFEKRGLLSPAGEAITPGNYQNLLEKF